MILRPVVSNLHQRKSSGFTLIEILVVLAIIGVLAVIVVMSINPAERQAQARDAGRVSSVAQLGRATISYYTSRSTYPSEAEWAQDLDDSGELSSFPSGIEYILSGTSNCTTYQQPGADPTYCYSLDATNGAIVFARAEATSHNDKCTAPEVAYFVYSSADGRGGTICSNGGPSPWVAGTQIYVD